MEGDADRLAGHRDRDAHRVHHRDHRGHQGHHLDEDHRILRDGDPRRDAAHSHQFVDHRDAHLQGANPAPVPDREAAEWDARWPTRVDREAAESDGHSVWSEASAGVPLPQPGRAAAWLDAAQNRVRGSK